MLPTPQREAERPGSFFSEVKADEWGDLPIAGDG